MNKHLVPFVRFRDYQSIWKEYKIGEIFTVTRGQVLATSKTSTIKSLENPYPVYSSQTKNNGLMGFYKSYLFDTAITWTTDGANAGTVKFRSGKFYSTNVNGVLLSNNGYTNVAVAEALNKIAWKYVSKVGNPKLMNNVMSEIKLRLPESIKEQNEISSFFKNLDDTIALHQQELEALKQTKQGFLQKMFPRDGENVPQIRFDEFTKPWTQIEFGKIIKLVGGATPLKENKEYWNGDIVWLSSQEIKNKYVSKGTYLITEQAVKDNRTKVVSEGTPLIVTRSGILAKRFPISISLNEVAINQDIKALIFDRERFDTEFVVAEIKSKESYILNNIVKTGTTVQSVNLPDLNRMNLYIPEYAEQLKIGQFFRQLDEVIELKEKEIEALKETKKGFLQKMFV